MVTEYFENTAETEVRIPHINPDFSRSFVDSDGIAIGMLSQDAIVDIGSGILEESPRYMEGEPEGRSGLNWDIGFASGLKWGARTGSLVLVDTSFSAASHRTESPEHREAAAVMDRYSRGLLWKISECTFMGGSEVMEFADDYDGLRAVLRAVRAGWATAAPDGLIVTDHGRDVARRMFVDR